MIISIERDGETPTTIPGWVYAGGPSRFNLWRSTGSWPRKKWWLRTEMLEATTFTGPFPSRRAAIDHRDRCTQGFCGGDDASVFKDWDRCGDHPDSHVLR